MFIWASSRVCFASSWGFASLACSLWKPRGLCLTAKDLLKLGICRFVITNVGLCEEKREFTGRFLLILVLLHLSEGHELFSIAQSMSDCCC